MTETAKRYGGSLYELAKEEQLTDELLSELETAVTCFGENADYMRLLTAENLPKKERCDLLDAAFEGAHPYLINFMKLLCEEGLLPELFGCVQAYRAQYNADHGIIEVTVVSAVPLQDASREKLLAKPIRPCWAVCGWIWMASAWTAPCSAAWKRCGMKLPAS